MPDHSVTSALRSTRNHPINEKYKVLIMQDQSLRIHPCASHSCSCNYSTNCLVKHHLGFFRNHSTILHLLCGKTFHFLLKYKGKFLYSTISSPRDCSMRLTLYSLADLLNQTPSTSLEGSTIVYCQVLFMKLNEHPILSAKPLCSTLYFD